jgi:hypothetical protein
MTLVALSLSRCPRSTFDRSAVLRAGRLHHDEDLGLRQDVLVEHGCALRDEQIAEALDAAAPDDRLERAQSARLLGTRSLRREYVGLVDNDEQRTRLGLLDAVQALEEVAGEALLSCLRQQRRQVEDVGARMLDDDVGED